MELGRRNFVQLLGAAAYSVATSSVSRVTLAAVEYRNAALGFALGKPSEWFYLSYEEYSQAGAELDNAEAVGDLRDSMGEPVVTIAKYCETPPVATPSISVFAEAPGWNATEADLFDFDFSPFADTLQDFHLEEDAEPDSLAGLTASRSAYSYRISSSSGESAGLRTVVYAVLRNGLMYSFNFTDVLNVPYSAEAELAAARRSLRFLD